MNDLENPSNFINLSPLSHNIFCSGHTHLPDGRIIIAGGHEDNDIGLKETIRFNVMNNSWTMLSLMGYDRWYPSLTTLADGRILVSGGTFGGSYENARPICEVYNPESNTWTSVVAGNDGLHYYPFMFVLPRAVTMKVNGQPTSTLFPAGSVFCAGWKERTKVLGYFSSSSFPLHRAGFGLMKFSAVSMTTTVPQSCMSPERYFLRVGVGQGQTQQEK